MKNLYQEASTYLAMNQASARGRFSLHSLVLVSLRCIKSHSQNSVYVNWESTFCSER